MTYREIRDWIKSEILFESDKSIDDEFRDISRIFHEGNRSDLEAIVSGEKKQFLEFLESVKREQLQSETDEDLTEAESRIQSLERSIDSFSEGTSRAINILGTPYFEIEEAVLSTWDRFKGFFGF